MFQHKLLSNGIDLFLNPTPKFRTNLVQVFVERPLDEDYTKFALLAQVLKRGTTKYPTTIELAQHWDSLYGALFSGNVYKLGEHHVFELQLELPSERYVSGQRVLRDGLKTLADMLISPVIVDGLLSPQHVTQEKQALVRAIDSLFNDKAQYSAVRCIAEMCNREAYARLELGHRDEVPSLSDADLTSFYKSKLPDAKYRVVITGDVAFPEAVAACEEAFTGLRSSDRGVAATQVDIAVGEVRVKEEVQEVNQAKLVMGLRAYADCASDDYPALLMCNGVLGAYAHSKLFVNVREKASLAYYCMSSLLPVKGIMLIRSGIAADKYEQVVEIINEQINHLRRGNISEDELGNTKLALFNSLRADEDRPAKLAQSLVERLVAGAHYTNTELRDRLDDVTANDIAIAANKLQLDTVYFLRGKE